MDVESPDGAKKFPGLFSAELQSGSDSELRVGRQLIGGKKKDKKEKDISYAALGESSADEEDECRHSLKSKKGHLFKFHKREKRDKLRSDEQQYDAKSKHSKESKTVSDCKTRVCADSWKHAVKLQKESVKTVECDTDTICRRDTASARADVRDRFSDSNDLRSAKNRESRKETKKKRKVKSIDEKKEKSTKKGSSKIKDKNKSTPSDVATDAAMEVELPVFGVSLCVAVERSKCYDGLPLPAIVRLCIDFIENSGLTCEGIYRLSGVKSKIQQLKRCFDAGEVVQLPSHQHEPHTVACLLKLFLRELPEPVLTAELLPMFELAAGLKDTQLRVHQLSELLTQLPASNLLLLQYVFKHMQHVIEQEKLNKMNVQNVSLVLSPTMHISHRVLNAFFMYGKILFSGVVIKKYIPPLAIIGSSAAPWPETLDEYREEVAKHECLLEHLHVRLNSAGLTSASNKCVEDQLWEAQRILTQLKRKQRLLAKQGDPSDSQGSGGVVVAESVESGATATAELSTAGSTGGTGAGGCEDVERPPSPGSPEQPPSSGGLKTVQIVSERNVTMIEVDDGTHQQRALPSAENSADDAILDPAVTPATGFTPSADACSSLDSTGGVVDDVPQSDIKSLYVSSVKNQASFSDLHRRHSAAILDQLDSGGAIDQPCGDQRLSFLTDGDLSWEYNDSSEQLNETELLREAVLLKLEEQELLATGRELRSRLNAERTEIGRILETVREMETLYKYRTYSTDSSDESSAEETGRTETTEMAAEDCLLSQLKQIVLNNEQLQASNDSTQSVIHRERRHCQRLRAKIRYIELARETTVSP